MASAHFPQPIEIFHERLDLSLYQAQCASYRTLRIVDQVWPCWIISHVLEGCVETTTCGHQAKAGVGDVMVHVPNLPFSEFADRAGIHQWMAFDIAASPLVALLRQYPVSPVVTLPQDSGYARTFEQLCEARNHADSLVHRLRVVSLAAKLVGSIIAAWQQAGSPPRPAALLTTEDRFLEVVNYMTSHLDEKITRHDLAQRAYLHPGYFDRVFRAAYGIPPMQMLRDLRLRQAQRLLETTEDSLDWVALRCGLGDAPALSRAFRARFGQSPGHYRQSSKKTRESYIPQ